MLRRVIEWSSKRALKSRDHDRRIKAIRKLRAAPRSSVQIAEALLDTSFEDVRREIFRVIAGDRISAGSEFLGAVLERVRTSGPKAIVPLLAGLKDDDILTRVKIVKLLGFIGPPLALAPLTEVMKKDPDVLVRWAAVKALCQFDDPHNHEIAAVLADALEDEHWEIRKLAATSLKSHASLTPAVSAEIDDVWSALEEANFDRWRQSPHLREFGARGYIGAETFDSLIVDLQQSNFWPMKTESVALVLDGIKREHPSRLVAHWISWLEQTFEIEYENDSYYPTCSSSLEYRYYRLKELEPRVEALGQAGVPPLTEALKHGNSYVREKAAELLARVTSSP